MSQTRRLGLALALLAAIAGIVVRAQAPTASPAELRVCTCSPDRTTLQTALDLKHAGWTYVMPMPKSAQAAWGNRDGRTTWYVGYWTNLKTRSTSSLQPIRDDKGQWVGDQKGIQAWRRGGSPPPPTQIEWLCSTSGGIMPR
jgi:hypothetical protein